MNTSYSLLFFRLWTNEAATSLANIGIDMMKISLHQTVMPHFPSTTLSRHDPSNLIESSRA
jgi:hypothetical protein